MRFIIKTHCKCLNCGFIRYNSTTMENCPRCRTRDPTMFVPSKSPKKELLDMACNLFSLPQDSPKRAEISQIINILMNQ